MSTFGRHTVCVMPIHCRTGYKVGNDQRLTHLLTRQSRRLFVAGGAGHGRRTGSGYGSLNHGIEIRASTSFFTFFPILNDIVLEICMRFHIFRCGFRSDRVAKSGIFLLSSCFFYASLIEGIRFRGGRNNFGCKRPSPIRYQFGSIVRFVGVATIWTGHVSVGIDRSTFRLGACR